MIINKIEDLIRKFKQSNNKPIDQLNFLTTINEELQKLIKETIKKVR
jgi:hypothetical protein